MAIVPFYSTYVFSADYNSVDLLAAKSSDVIDINTVMSSDNLGWQISYTEDITEQKQLEGILALDDEFWQENARKHVNLGYSDAAFWFKLPLINSDSEARNMMLKIGYSVLDYVDVHLVKAGKDIASYHLGDKLSFTQRIIQNRHFLVPLAFEKHEQLDVFLRIKTSSSVQLPLSIWGLNDFYEADQTRMMFHGIYFGIALVMIVYNLFVYAAISEKTYLYYVACITCMAVFLASLNGLTFQYIWPNSTWWNDQSIVFFLNGVVFFAILFAKEFLSIGPIDDKRLSRFIFVFGLIGALMMVLSLVLPYQSIIKPTITVAMIGCISLISVGAYRWYKGYVAARYFTIAWFSLLLGGIVLALNKLTILPQNIVTENATQIGSAIEIILLSLALADRLYQEKKNTLCAQHVALNQERAVREAQEQTLKIQQDANVMLEHRVQERTTELEQLNARLVELSSTDALTNLKNRGYFDETFRTAFIAAYRYKRPIALLVVDIDNFKAVNDDYGHLAGDECLKLVSESLQQIIYRPQDLVARYGGEEFVVLLPDTPNAGAEKVGEKMRKWIEIVPFRLAEKTINLTVSIGGVSLTPEVADKRSAMFDKADEALYVAKRAGRNRVEMASG